jgi:hypothetical protein
MKSSTERPRSLADIASCGSLVLALAGACVLGILGMANEVAPFATTSRGLLSGFLPRALLYVVWATEALAVVVGVGSFLLIRRHDVAAGGVIWIAVRGLLEIAAGLVEMLFMWLLIGHIIIGF